ncbi:MAG TPA: hypothetical protein VEZ26_09550 [Sphingomonadaceae bacterium]|nr:hypothetical protein [Sphingomonadaceae bacterium]
MTAGVNTVPARRLSAPLPELSQSRDRQPATRAPLATSSGQTSPFGAQLVRAEGGLQLVLRLPKLAESDRTALETALAHLLEDHGHHRTAIIIHEVTKG